MISRYVYCANTVLNLTSAPPVVLQLVRQNSCPMMPFAEIRFIRCHDYESPRAKEIADSERRSHAARHAHRQHRLSQQKPRKKSKATVVHSQGSDRCKSNDFVGDKWQDVVISQPQSGHWTPSENNVDNLGPEACLRHDGIPSQCLHWPDRKRNGLEFLEASVATTRLTPLSTKPFNTDADHRLFDLWRARVAPFMGRFRPTYHDIINVLIPQFAWSSTAVRHMLLAHAAAYQTNILGPLSNNTCSRKAAWHTSKAFSCIANDGASLTEKVIVFYLAWATEGLRGNLAGCTKLLECCRVLVNLADTDDVDSLRSKFTPILEHAQNVEHLTKGRPDADWIVAVGHREEHRLSGRVKDLATIERTRQSISWLVSYILESRFSRETAYEAKIHDGIGPWLEYWISTHPAWDEGYAQTNITDVLYLLFDTLATLLPHEVVADINSNADQNLAE